MCYSNVIWLSACCVFAVRQTEASSTEHTLMVRVVQMAGALQLSAGLARNEPWTHASRGFPPTAGLICS